MSWELPTLTITCVSILGLWWFLNRHSANPGSAKAHAGVTGFAVLLDYRRAALRLCESSYHSAINATPIQQFKMALTLGAVVW
jgi:hypothetical protein